MYYRISQRMKRRLWNSPAVRTDSVYSVFRYSGYGARPEVEWFGDGFRVTEQG